jgi:lysophospholipase L1-like esterase
MQKKETMPSYLFAGDSLTEGIVGESYLERVAKALYSGRYGLKGEVLNAGRGGDTATSLLRRLSRTLDRYQPHWIILAVGSNDVWFQWLSTHSLGWWLWLQYRGLRFGQTPTTDQDEFASTYRALIDQARQCDARVLACTISPLGERLSTPVNHRVARLNGVIKHVAADCQVPVADVWQAFVEELARLPSHSGYLPGEWLFTWAGRRHTQETRPDELAQRRRLHLTCDGIHLNSRGATLWAETILAALARSQNLAGAPFSDLVRRWSLPCFKQGLLDVCCTEGWEARARDVAQLLADAYESLVFVTGARPGIRLAVLNEVYWNQSARPGPYPRPVGLWDGEPGTVFVPEAYGDSFLRELHVPETVAGWSLWPPELAHLGAPARATALADLLAVQELAQLFLRELNVAPADPALQRLLTAYLTQVVLHALGGGGSGLAVLWNEWGRVLAHSGAEEGRVRLRAMSLFAEHGGGLVTLFTGHSASTEAQITALLGARVPQR